MERKKFCVEELVVQCVDQIPRNQQARTRAIEKSFCIAEVLSYILLPSTSESCGSEQVTQVASGVDRLIAVSQNHGLDEPNAGIRSYRADEFRNQVLINYGIIVKQEKVIWAEFLKRVANSDVVPFSKPQIRVVTNEFHLWEFFLDFGGRAIRGTVVNDHDMARCVSHAEQRFETLDGVKLPVPVQHDCDN